MSNAAVTGGLSVGLKQAASPVVPRPVGNGTSGQPDLSQGRPAPDLTERVIPRVPESWVVIQSMEVSTLQVSPVHLRECFH